VLARRLGFDSGAYIKHQPLGQTLRNFLINISSDGICFGMKIPHIWLQQSLCGSGGRQLVNGRQQIANLQSWA